MDVRTFVDRTWSDVFGLPPEELTVSGVRVVADPPGLDGYRGLYLLRLGAGCTIAAPADIADDVRRRADGLSAEDVFRSDAAHALAGPDAGLVLGPSMHAYVDADLFVPQPPCGARRLGPDDTTALDGLHVSVTEDEWAEGGFTHVTDDLWGVFEDSTLVAAGNMTDFAGHAADVGLLTHPRARGRGLGSRLAGAMTADALRTIPVIRYRALETNLPSRAISRKLGFADHGANIAVRLRATDA